MKASQILWISALLVVISLDTWAGTGVGNGPVKTSWSDPSWIPIGGLGDLKGQREYNESDFVTRTGLVLQFCRSNPAMHFPPFPDSLKNSISIEDENGKSVELSQICKSQKLISGYRDLVFSLYDLQDMLLFKYFVEKGLALDQGKPVSIRLFSKLKAIEGRGGHNENEYTWFDYQGGWIGWAPQTPKQVSLIEIMTSRGPPTIFMHELAHLVTYRHLGGYPELKYWHDFRFDMHEMKVERGIPEIVSSNFYKFETSPVAALTESMSNLAELPFAMQHPMVEESYGSDESTGEFRPIKMKSDAGKELDVLATPVNERFKLAPEVLMSNEALLTTLLHRFSQRFYANEKEGSVFIGTQQEMARDLFEAYLSQDPAKQSFFNIFEAYDRAHQSDEGWVFLMQYMHYNYREHRYLELGKDFATATSTDRKGSPVVYAVARRNYADGKMFQRDIVAAHRDELAEKAQRAQGLQTPYEETMNLALHRAEILRALNQSLQAKRPALETRISDLQKKYSTLLAGKSESRGGAEFSMQVVDHMQRQGKSQPWALMTLDDIFTQFNQPRVLLDQIDQDQRRILTHLEFIASLANKLKTQSVTVDALSETSQWEYLNAVNYMMAMSDSTSHRTEDSLEVLHSFWSEDVAQKLDDVVSALETLRLNEKSKRP